MKVSSENNEDVTTSLIHGCLSSRIYLHNSDTESSDDSNLLIDCGLHRNSGVELHIALTLAATVRSG